MPALSPLRHAGRSEPEALEPGVRHGTLRCPGNSRQARNRPSNRHDQTLGRQRRPRTPDSGKVMSGTLAGIAAGLRTKASRSPAPACEPGAQATPPVLRHAQSLLDAPPQDILGGSGPFVLDQVLDLRRMEPGPEEVCAARSSFSQSRTSRPRPAASRAMHAPLMPPPMTGRSTAFGPDSLALIRTRRSRGRPARERPGRRAAPPAGAPQLPDRHARQGEDAFALPSCAAARCAPRGCDWLGLATPTDDNVREVPSRESASAHVRGQPATGRQGTVSPLTHPTKADNSCATKPDRSICCQQVRILPLTMQLAGGVYSFPICLEWPQPQLSPRRSPVRSEKAGARAKRVAREAARRTRSMRRNWGTR